MHFILVDFQKCHGCRSCELACSFHGTGEFNVQRANLSVIEIPEAGAFIPVTCRHCLEAPCMDICPAQALYRDGETGAVCINERLCIGCKMCLSACPFGAPRVDSIDLKVVKCDLCKGTPQCVQYCGFGALKYVPVEKAANMRRTEGAYEIFRILNQLSS